MVYLIRDPTDELWLNYADYRINALMTSVKAPSMNSILEWWWGD